ncbi:hypothetical protein NONO_c21630 [Nocardia nova SH22a]|uniref:Aminoglycoside phosphotransferase domain-containing protein n=2 Tax=Nocardia nova TaxID=37330 RepID=W5TIB1_9NOCA|nr:hypothetical protein NONO_c21630 [Nocardia nova SH22a]
MAAAGALGYVDLMKPDSVADQPLAPLLEWATGRLAALGLTVTGAEEMRRRDWTLLARIHTGDGPFWAKASARAFAHEGPLLLDLARLRPGSVLEPVAVHRDNGWMLNRDGGETMRSGPLDRQVAGDSPRPPEWDSVLRAYAGLQYALGTQADVLRASGTPYLPPSRLVEVYRRFAEHDPGLVPAIAAAADELEQSGRLAPEHNDLYPGHVFRTTGAIFDWGDSLITHPFLSIRTHTDPRRQAYFDAWREFAPITDREIELSARLAPLTTLHSWLSIDTAPGSAGERFAPFVADMLARLRRAFS